MPKSRQIAEMLKLINKEAIMNLSQGNFAEALQMFEQGKTLEEKLGLKKQVAESLLNIANIHYLTQHYDACLKNLKEAEKIFTGENNQEGIFKVLQLLIGLHFTKNEYLQSAQACERCLTLAISEKDKATSYFQGGVSYIKLNNHFRAQQYLNLAVKIFSEIKDQASLIDSLRQRALLFKNTARTHLALNDLRRALELTSDDETKAVIEKQILNCQNNNRSSFF